MHYINMTRLAGNMAILVPEGQLYFPESDISVFIESKYDRCVIFKYENLHLVALNINELVGTTVLGNKNAYYIGDMLIISYQNCLIF